MAVIVWFCFYLFAKCNRVFITETGARGLAHKRDWAKNKQNRNTVKLKAEDSFLPFLFCCFWNAVLLICFQSPSCQPPAFRKWLVDTWASSPKALDSPYRCCNGTASSCDIGVIRGLGLWRNATAAGPLCSCGSFSITWEEPQYHAIASWFEHPGLHE